MAVGNRSMLLAAVLGGLVTAAPAGAQVPKITLQEAIERANLVHRPGSARPPGRFFPASP